MQGRINEIDCEAYTEVSRRVLCSKLWSILTWLLLSGRSVGNFLVVAAEKVRKMRWRSVLQNATNDAGLPFAMGASNPAQDSSLPTELTASTFLRIRNA